MRGCKRAGWGPNSEGSWKQWGNVDYILVITIVGITWPLLDRKFSWLYAGWITGNKRVDMGAPVERLLWKPSWLGRK